MDSLSFLYVGFGLIVFAIIAIYYFSASFEKEREEFGNSKIWMYSGVGYAIMLLNSGVASKYGFYAFYIFLLVSLYMSLYILSANTQHLFIIPHSFYIGIQMFNFTWVIYGIYQGLDMYVTILPMVLLQSMAFFFAGLIYLLYEDYEMSMRNISGMLMLVLSLVKLFYVLTMEKEYIFSLAVFRVDFLLYVVLAFVLVLFDFNKKHVKKNEAVQQMLELLDSVPMGMLLINPRGDIMRINDKVEAMFSVNELQEFKAGKMNLLDVENLPFERYWNQILDTVNENKTYTMKVGIPRDEEIRMYEFLFMQYEEKDESNNPILAVKNIACFIIYNQEQSEQRVDEDIPTSTHNRWHSKYEVMEAFDNAVTHHHMTEFGGILIKIVNYDAIKTLMDPQDEFLIDEILMDKISELESIHGIGKISHDSYLILTGQLADEYKLKDQVDLIDFILHHQTYYDVNMNAYNLDYRMSVALYPKDGKTYQAISSNTSIAMAKVMAEEKGHIQFYNTSVRDEIVHKFKLESKLRDGIYNDELFIHYQPQYKAQNEEIRGFEALVRWKISEDAVLSPDEFLPIAESMNLMDELGDWVLREALKEAVIWNIEYKKGWMLSVNVSLSQLDKEGFAARVIQAVNQVEYPPELLEIEVTETKMATSTDRAYIELKKLRDCGIKIAIDDFGTGYSSLEYLRWIPFDVLKIDKGFIDRLDESEMDNAIVGSILDLVQKLKLEAVAEGVETASQLAYLKEANIDYIQGYVYSRPISAEAVMDLINS